MKDVKYLLFDLDGTITASDEGITKSVQYALHCLGIEEPDLNKLKPFVGPPLRVAFPQYYGLDKEKTEEAVSKYRERYSKEGIFECSVYDGMPDVLAKLKNKGYCIVLATSKPKIYAEKILKHFNLDGYFTHVVGCELDGRLDTKSEIIEYAIELCADADKSHFIMIGDRFYDIEGAKQQGIRSVGVLYGYGSREELEGAGADEICPEVKDIALLFGA